MSLKPGEATAWWHYNGVSNIEFKDYLRRHHLVLTYRTGTFAEMQEALQNAERRKELDILTEDCRREQNRA